MALILCGGCSNEIPPGEHSGPRAVAAMRATLDQTTYAFVEPANQHRLAEILGDTPPMNFHWVSITLPNALDVHAGANADLAQGSPTVRFRQVYGGVCNPAGEDFTFCWLHESYVSGETGLTGQLRLKLDGGIVDGMWDLSWEGITDRFQGQPQWHRHGTTASYVATLEVLP
jgi:hypothetical protein